ncbi:hypothetical protein [Fodinibius sp. SL11]|uniref:hypothetical protein n=1 Tax=Fodinibius sp. SL11 TaxID=3425690 RepID=UPI003F883C5F
MKTIRLITSSILLLFAVQSMAVAQSTDIKETFKKHFNKTVQQVQETESADKKRMLLNESFTKMLEAVDRIESRANLSEDKIAQLNSFKNGISEKKSELNGLEGFDEVVDEDLDDFSEYSQDFMEQADRTLTIGLTTALLIVIILLLL